MNIDFLKRLLWFTVLIVVQVFVLNHIHLFAVATPAAVQPFVLQPFIPRDSGDDFQPGMDTLGVPQYTWYASILTFIYNVVFFSLEMFSFFNVLEWLECVIGSSLLTLILILVVENVRRR